MTTLALLATSRKFLLMEKEDVPFFDRQRQTYMNNALRPNLSAEDKEKGWAFIQVSVDDIPRYDKGTGLFVAHTHPAQLRPELAAMQLKMLEIRVQDVLTYNPGWKALMKSRPHLLH
jgi:hypothetical protein